MSRMRSKWDLVFFFYNCLTIYNFLQQVPYINFNIPYFNTLRPRQNVRRFTDDTFKRIFLNENVRISIKISLKFVPQVPINNIPALVQIMAWRRPGDNPLSEPMMVGLLTHICVTLPQWVNRHTKACLLRWVVGSFKWGQSGWSCVTLYNCLTIYNFVKWFTILHLDQSVFGEYNSISFCGSRNFNSILLQSGL